MTSTAVTEAEVVAGVQATRYLRHGIPYALRLLGAATLLRCLNRLGRRR